MISYVNSSISLSLKYGQSQRVISNKPRSACQQSESAPGCHHVGPSPCPALPEPRASPQSSLQIGLQRLLLGGFAKMASEFIWSSIGWGRNRRASSVGTIQMAGDRHFTDAQASQIDRWSLNLVDHSLAYSSIQKSSWASIAEKNQAET